MTHYISSNLDCELSIQDIYFLTKVQWKTVATTFGFYEEYQKDVTKFVKWTSVQIIDAQNISRDLNRKCFYYFVVTLI